MGTITSIDSTHATVTFTYHNATGHTGTIVLGDIIATVPNSAASIYKTVELLALNDISITGGATVLPSDGIHVDAYQGDVHVTAAPAIDASDALDAENVASGAWTGFSVYTLLDPAIIGGFIAGHTISVDPADVSALFTEAAHANVPQLPSIPPDVTIVSVGGAEPSVSLGDAAAGQMFQIGNVPALNNLLSGKSPGQLAVNEPFPALAPEKADDAAVHEVEVSLRKNSAELGGDDENIAVPENVIGVRAASAGAVGDGITLEQDAGILAEDRRRRFWFVGLQPRQRRE